METPIRGRLSGERLPSTSQPNRFILERDYIMISTSVKFSSEAFGKFAKDEIILVHYNYSR